MSTSDVTHLQKQIEEKKKQLRQLVKAYGYTNPIVLACSQELDQLVYLFMRDYSPQKDKFKK
ncbi:Spo0E family sporulation regulatory protein-aspartic acid phosphatase [Bacillus thuringiensis serovar medellin]|uniref:Spo0E family sporulation regulatory protein-aspartic acid phosphatase n=1 Tax=Bacillus thuringiensis subsp. medellin TaxID=79672 RepID=A0A9X6MME5_BACTV|nr:aspartyl-phosphate phosphatase Spo0E family protein [Bacillus thuringiensis]OUB82595.1 Spo0E family sporulation regulatory protein-aspartic acid phosphatase [Bacillus thuringiensis serovar medellin]